MNMPAPTDWKEFELMSRDALSIRWANPDLQMHGRQGQAQAGVDIYGHNSLGNFVGAQCKLSEQVEIATVQKEIENAETFTPALEEFWILVGGEIDAQLQKEARSISRDRISNKKFGVGVLFWPELYGELAKDPALLKKHYPSVFGQLSAPDETREVDRAVFQRLKEMLPQDGSIEWLRDNNFAGFSFRLDSLRDLDRFHAASKDSSFEFLNADINARLKKLQSSVSALLISVARNTFGTGTPGFNGVPSEWEIEQPERFERVVEEIHSHADDTCQAYDDLIRAARRTLAVP